MENARLRVAAVPEWVAHDPYDVGLSQDDEFVAGGQCLLLLDKQTDITGDVTAYHTRVVRRVVTRAGAERVAQFSIVFNPEFQRLDVHYVRVKRGENAIEYADINAFDLLRRETNLERRILDGRLTATLVLPNVYVGDVVESCWTTYDSNPILRGRYSQWFEFLSPEPALAIRHRLLSRHDQQIKLLEFGSAPVADVEKRGELLDRRWSVERVPKLEAEPLTPPWQVLGDCLQASEMPGWNAVARAVAASYEPDSLPDTFREEISRIVNAAGANPIKRADAILRFVQDRLRYLSLSIGEGGYLPRPVAAIWQSGYGDCKDASRLLVAAAKLAGIDAFPALVSTRYGPALNNWLPAMSAFDHCIVKFIVNGSTYWVDPTLRAERGSIDRQPNYQSGWALPLRDDTQELEFMPEPPPLLLVDVNEKLIFGQKVDSAASLTVRVDYAAISASNLRDQIANQGQKQFSENFRKMFQAAWPALNEIEPLRIEDTIDDNHITVCASYEITQPWKIEDKLKVTAQVADHFMSSSLAPLAPHTRRNEIHLGPPRILRWHLEAVMPTEWGGDAIRKVLAAPGLKFTKNIRIQDNYKIIMDAELRVDKSTLPPEKCVSYSQIAGALQENRALIFAAYATGSQFISFRRPVNERKVANAGIAICFGFVLLILLAILGKH